MIYGKPLKYITFALHTHKHKIIPVTFKCCFLIYLEIEDIPRVHYHFDSLFRTQTLCLCGCMYVYLCVCLTEQVTDKKQIEVPSVYWVSVMFRIGNVSIWELKSIFKENGAESWSFKKYVSLF